MSRESENLLGVIILPSNIDEDSSYLRNFAWVHRNYPGVLEKLASMDTRSKRRAMKKAGLSPPFGQGIAEQPLMQIDMGFWKPHFDMFARKVILSLFYQSFRTPLTKGGRLIHMYETNFEVMKSGNLPTLANSIPTLVMPKRSNIVLADQFSLRYATDQSTQTAIYVLNFHSSLYLTGVISETPSLLVKGAPEGIRLQTCLEH